MLNIELHFQQKIQGGNILYILGRSFLILHTVILISRTWLRLAGHTVQQFC